MSPKFNPLIKLNLFCSLSGGGYIPHTRFVLFESYLGHRVVKQSPKPKKWDDTTGLAGAEVTVLVAVERHRHQHDVVTMTLETVVTMTSETVVLTHTRTAADPLLPPASSFAIYL